MICDSSKCTSVCDYITCQRICIKPLWSAVILIHNKGCHAPHCPAIEAVTSSAPISLLHESAVILLMHVKLLLNSLRVNYLTVSSKWFNHKAQGPEKPRELWQPAFFAIHGLGDWRMGIGAEFNTSTQKNEVVKIPIHLFYIFVYYSKDIWLITY